MKRFFTNKLLLSGVIIVALFSVIAMLAPIIAPYDPLLIQFNNAFVPPCTDFIFGTDELGRDVFSRMIYGTRISMFVGIIAVFLSVSIGVSVGLFAGYYGKYIDSFLMRLTDVMLCFPTFFLILAVVAFLDPSLFNVMVVIGVTGWMGIARLVRAEVLTLRQRDFIIAAHIGGVTTWKILIKHILPNVTSVITVSATLGVAGAILTESSLSFLGLGVQPPMPSWGNILMQGKNNILIAWWLSFFPGIAILLTVLGFNLLGEGLREQFSGKRK